MLIARGSVLSLTLASACVHPTDTGPYECPDSGDRFTPEVSPQDLVTSHDWPGEWVCEGHDGYESGDCRFWCTPEICAAGYEGTYCVSILRVSAWASEADGGTAKYGFYYTSERLDASETAACHASCTPGYEESK